MVLVKIDMTMQLNPEYKNVVIDVLNFFVKQVKIAQEIGVTDIIIDPGFGFGKSLNHNFELLKGLNLFKKISCPILIGLSRKSMLNFNSNSPHQRLYKSLSMHAVSVLNGADIIRTHDPVETRDSLEPILELKKY